MRRVSRVFQNHADQKGETHDERGQTTHHHLPPRTPVRTASSCAASKSRKSYEETDANSQSTRQIGRYPGNRGGPLTYSHLHSRRPGAQPASRTQATRYTARTETASRAPSI